MKKILIILILFIICGCTINATKENTEISKTETNSFIKKRDILSNINIIIDKETGVNYIVYWWGSSDSGVGMTVRLNADGSIYTSEIESEKQ